MKYRGTELSDNKICSIFRLIASNHLAECSDNGYDCLNPLKPYLIGSDSELTDEVLANTLVMLSGMATSMGYSLRSATIVGAAKGAKGRVSNNFDTPGILSELKGTSLEVEGYKDKSGEDLMGINFDDDDFDNSEDSGVKEPEDSGVDDSDDFVGSSESSIESNDEDNFEDNGDEQEVEHEDEPVKEPEKPEPSPEELKKEAICRYYAAYYSAPIQNLIKRYTAMFSSGYEVDKPAGVLTRDGIVQVSSSKRTVYEDSIATSKIYEIVRKDVSFKELESRSVNRIANDIWQGYNSDASLLYFPNKMLEFAYGLEAPTGDDQDSVNTYNRHAKASSWSAFVSSELESSVRRLMKGLLYGFVVKSMEKAGIDNYKDPKIANSLQDYMEYAVSCLSLCFLFTEYKIAVIEGDPQMVSFTFRVCDPTCRIFNSNITGEIISSAFLHGEGSDPYSYPPRVEQKERVIEFSHEFNHSMAQATPLFAYKALRSIMSDGKSISWDNLILGRGDDGKILKCGEGGFINLALKLTHEIDAGSRAGKGVMTLNLLASGIASLKNCFYFDCKPDMASILKFMCPEMFILNGGGYDANYDSMNQWGPDKTDAVASMNVPFEARKAFGVQNATWTELGDVFYLRGILLVLGILLARGSGKGADPNWGGKEGLLVIVDEFRVFQANFRSIMNEVFAKIPNTVMEKSREAVSKGSMSEVEFERCYNDVNYYALTFVNALADSMKFLAKKRDAGFDSSEVARSDIFIIGQDLYDGPVDTPEFVNSFIKSSASNRYKTAAVGMNSSFGNNICNAETSIPYTMLHFKGADAFFGRNVDTDYLAQTNTGSRAYGRLDDKASNFAYLPNFTESIRTRLNSGKVFDNIQIANDCKYFKPYLILNESSMDSRCVSDMFDRCYTNAGLTREEVISDNPDPNNLNNIHPAVGFIDYIKMAGTEDYQASMKKSGELAQRVVSALGYEGTWLEFICDLRPEWIFTVKDIVDVALGQTPSLANPLTNPILTEWVEFNPSRFDSDYVDPDVLSANEMDEFLDEPSPREDFSDDEKQFAEADERLAHVFDSDNIYSDEDFQDDSYQDDNYQGEGYQGEGYTDEGSEDEYYTEDTEIDIFDEEAEDTNNWYEGDDFDEGSEEGIILNADEDLEDSSTGDIVEPQVRKPLDLTSPRIKETGYGTKKDKKPSVSPEVQMLLEEIAALKAQIEELKSVPVDTVDVDESKASSGSDYKQTDVSDLAEEISDIDFREDEEIVSLESLMTIITGDVINTYGGLERMTSLRVVGGSLVINGYTYRCCVRNLKANKIPYDIRRKINAGTVAELFNYNFLYGMRLRKLVIDSVDFAYDYVSPQMGLTGTIGVDTFFKAMPTLQEFVLGKRRFTRANYTEQLTGMGEDSDLFYKTKLSSKVADYTQEHLSKWNSNSWSFTKKYATNKDCNLIVRTAAVTAGLGASAATLVGKAGMSAGRKLMSGISMARLKSNAKGFGKGIKDLFNT